MKLLLERLLVSLPPPGFVFAGGVLSLVPPLAEVLLDLHLLAASVEVVRVSVVEVSHLPTTKPSVLMVVMEPLEPVDNQCQLVITKPLNLLI